MPSEWDKERKFEIEKVHPMYLITALCVVPFGVYFLLNFLSPLIHRLTAMTISEIYVYPIKSLRGVKVKEALGTAHGFKHDRIDHLTLFDDLGYVFLANGKPGTFMLLRITPEGPVPMAVSKQPEMTQFLQEIHGYNDADGSLRVTFRAFGNAEAEKSLTIPLTPDPSSLEATEITLHSSATRALQMPQSYNDWFTSCFGYAVQLIYIGAHTRAVLFDDMQPREPSPLTRFLRAPLPFTTRSIASAIGLRPTSPQRIAFADCAPFLVVSQTSVDDVSSRLPAGHAMDVTKFRPNIVVQGALDAYQEDYWGVLSINNSLDVVLAHNCVRCASVNVDYETGRPGKGELGDVLKKLQEDRRIDVGARWSPVFGRYSFWGVGRGDEVVRVGDRVNVKKVNDGLSIFSWPGLS